MRTALAFVGAHLLLGVCLLAIEATHGINDQDASFAVALLFRGLNYPTVRLLRLLGAEPGIAAVLLAGIVPWALLGAAVATAWRAVRGRAELPAAPHG
ncbi:MAG: hypothetical protein FJ221_19305 [Lentisphaerae bacterium]|nr:hypothetical protein [Lentisphaerota bacterium]